MKVTSRRERRTRSIFMHRWVPYERRRILGEKAGGGETGVYLGADSGLYKPKGARPGYGSNIQLRKPERKEQCNH